MTYPVNKHQHYHAHVYFDQNTLQQATDLIQQVGEQFPLKTGRIHQKPVGLHMMWSCQILFSKDDFETLIPFLDEHRKGLSILVHAVTGDDLKDHTDYAYWLGEPAPLDLQGFS